ncbi:MAG TPA: amidohydrolase family protein [Thermoanaerobaculia bacterium]|nr:amidohydrolase family protein [Thermoanaerobaculia bacterium]
MKHALIPAMLFAAVSLSAQQPSLIIVNGNVFTNDPEKPSAQAIAITGSQITAVGSNAQIKGMAGEKTRVYDAQGRLVIPGFNDAHMHPASGSPAFALSTELDAKWDQIASALQFATDEMPADMWITGTLGPALINDPTLTREKLDKAARGRKVLLHAFTGHGLVMSSAAMKALGVADDAPDPLGGRYERDANGKLNGRAQEYAQWIVERRFADLASDDEMVEAIMNLSGEALRYGITSVQAMPMASEERFAKAMSKANVPLRIRLISFPMDAGKPQSLQPRGAIKWILDGTPIERGAALREARYADDTSGRENFADIGPLLQVAADKKAQLLVHASGDKTIATVLNALSTRALDRPRLEHADGLLRDLVPLAKRAGAIAVLNPSHFPLRDFFPKSTPYMPAATLVKSEIPIAIGSDGPLNPFLSFMLAVARPDQPNESLTRQQALRAYTSGSAYAEFTEKTKGRIAPGMLADLAVLSQDIITAPTGALPETVSVLTVIDGKVAYEQ